MTNCHFGAVTSKCAQCLEENRWYMNYDRNISWSIHWLDTWAKFILLRVNYIARACMLQPCYKATTSKNLDEVKSNAPIHRIDHVSAVHFPFIPWKCCLLLFGDLSKDACTTLTQMCQRQTFPLLPPWLLCLRGILKKLCNRQSGWPTDGNQTSLEIFCCIPTKTRLPGSSRTAQPKMCSTTLWLFWWWVEADSGFSTGNEKLRWITLPWWLGAACLWQWANQR